MSQPSKIQDPSLNPLIYEWMDGQAIYYKGYQSVLDKTKTLEEIMGSSALQAEIIMYLLNFIMINIGIKDYRIYTNEVGSHIDKGNNLAHDIAIFDKKVLPSSKVSSNYTDVPPKMVIEFDLDAAFEQLESNEYLHTKTQKMLDFGVEKVLWITTKTKKVTVATKGAPWQIFDWNQDIELLNGFSFNIGAYLKSENISLEG